MFFPWLILKLIHFLLLNVCTYTFESQPKPPTFLYIITTILAEYIYIFSSEGKRSFSTHRMHGLHLKGMVGWGGGGKARREVPHSPILCLPNRTLCPIWSIYLVFRNLVEKLCFMNKCFFYELSSQELKINRNI